MKLSKVEMCFPEISFLGHQIKHGSVTTDDNIVSKILKIEPSKTKKHVQALLGLINYSKFIPCFAEKTAVLSSLLKKEVRKIVWTNQCQKILDEIKVLFSSSPILKIPDFRETYNASNCYFRLFMTILPRVFTSLLVCKQKIVSCREELLNG